MRVFPMLNIKKPERRGLFCSLLLGAGGWGERRVHVWEQFVNRPSSQLVTGLSLGWSPFIWPVMHLPLPCLVVQILIEAACGTKLKPGTLGCVCIPSWGRAWAGAGLVDLSVGCWLRSAHPAVDSSSSSLCSSLYSSFPFCIHQKRPVHYTQLCC